VTGYGHSLFRIDLRNDSSSLVWSPSHAEYLTEGLHSISGILPDANREHVLWVSSSSACKVWALDVRYKSAKVVVSWSLPSLCDDFGAQIAVTGIHGGGVLMSQPIPSCMPNDQTADSPLNCQPPAMFSLKKDPNSYAVGVHQFPSAMPRFHAKPVESSGFQDVSKLKYDVSSIARSAIFPLPDVSDGVFNIGLVTLQCSSKTALDNKQLIQLGYQTPPTNTTYVISMTSIGDIYCHSLLETNAMEETTARQFAGLPVGTKAVPVPGKIEKMTTSPHHMRLTLSNGYPVPSCAITPYVIRELDDCCKFKSFEIEDILNRNQPPELQMQEDGDDGERNKDVYTNLASVCEAPHPVYDLMKVNEATKEAMMNLSDDDENVETFRVAFGGTKDSKEEDDVSEFDVDRHSNNHQASVKHSLPRFGVATATNTDPIRRELRRQQICLSSSHMTVVATRKEDDAKGSQYDSDNEERPNEEMGLDFLERLQRNYFKESGNGEGIVKSEWSSDSE